MCVICIFFMDKLMENVNTLWLYYLRVNGAAALSLMGRKNLGLKKVLRFLGFWILRYKRRVHTIAHSNTATNTITDSGVILTLLLSYFLCYFVLAMLHYSAVCTMISYLGLLYVCHNMLHYFIWHFLTLLIYVSSVSYTIGCSVWWMKIINQSERKATTVNYLSQWLWVYYVELCRAVFVRFSLGGGQSFDWRLATIAGMEVAKLVPWNSLLN